MFKAALNFLFGKTNDIFDKDGNVVHRLPDDRWRAWRDRFEKNPAYDWHRHCGTERTPKAIASSSRPANQNQSRPQTSLSTNPKQA